MILTFCGIGFLFSNSVEAARPQSPTKILDTTRVENIPRTHLRQFCGRYFDTCKTTYNAKTRKFKDPKCEKVMKQCFAENGPSQQKCDDQLYRCLDLICKPRSACRDASRVRQMGLSCLQQAGRYYPYVCSETTFNGVVAQVVSEGGTGGSPAPQIIQQSSGPSPQVQAQLQQQAQQMAEQQALLRQQQQEMEALKSQSFSSQMSENSFEEDADDDFENADMWGDLEKCQNLLSGGDRQINLATTYAGCAPTVSESDIIYENENVYGFNTKFDFFGGGSGGFKGDSKSNDTSDEKLNTSSGECSSAEVKRLRMLKYYLDEAFREVNRSKDCAYQIVKKASRKQMNSDYTQTLRKKFRMMNSAKIRNSINKLNVDNYVDDDYQEKTPSLPYETAIEYALYNIRAMHVMNQSVLEDIENMLSGVAYFSPTGAQRGGVCIGMVGQSLHECVARESLQILQRNVSSPSRSLGNRLIGLNLVSAYNLCTNTSALEAGDPKTIKGCAGDIYQRAQQEASKGDSYRR